MKCEYLESRIGYRHVTSQVQCNVANAEICSGLLYLMSKGTHNQISPRGDMISLKGGKCQQDEEKWGQQSRQRKWHRQRYAGVQMNATYSER